MKKVIQTIFNIICVIVIVVGSVLVVYTLVSNLRGESATFFGYQFKNVLTESMEKNDKFDASGFEIKDIAVGDVVVVKTVGRHKAEFYASLKVGDVITFAPFKGELAGETVTHRIKSIQSFTVTRDGGEEIVYYIVTQGDNNPDITVESMTSDDNIIVGRVTATSKVWGKVVTFMKNKYTIIFAVIIPSVILIVIEIIKIVTIINANRSKTQQEKVQSAANLEIEELKRQLQQMQQAQQGSGVDTNKEDVTEADAQQPNNNTDMNE